MIRCTFSCLLLGSTLAMACAPYEIDDSRRELLESWAQDFLFPRYAATLDGIADLDLAAQMLCESPAPTTLTSAQDAWWQARAPWKQTEVFAFGPFQEEPLRLGPKIDAWPLRPAAVQTVLDGDLPLDVETLNTLGVYAKGFPAAEYLLFAPMGEVTEEFLSEGRRCQYLHAVIGDLALRVTQLDSAWQPGEGGYLLQLTGAGSERSQRYASLEKALGEIVNRMGFSVENIQVDKLGAPLGKLNGNDPRPQLAESTLSGRSIEDIRDNLRGIDALFVGSAEAPALNAYLMDDGYYVAATMQERMDSAQQALDAIDLPLTVALVDAREKVVVAQAELRKLQSFIQIDLLKALTLTLEFNDADGD